MYVRLNLLRHSHFPIISQFFLRHIHNSAHNSPVCHSVVLSRYPIYIVRVIMTASGIKPKRPNQIVGPVPKQAPRPSRIGILNSPRHHGLRIRHFPRLCLSSICNAFSFDLQTSCAFTPLIHLTVLLSPTTLLGTDAHGVKDVAGLNQTHIVTSHALNWDGRDIISQSCIKSVLGGGMIQNIRPAPAT